MCGGIGCGDLLNTILLLTNTILILYAAKQIRTVEIATNSMKDALVLATGQAEHAKGKIEGKAEAHAQKA